MRIKYSQDVDILSVELEDKPADYAQENGAFIVHYSQDGRPVLIEIQGAREFLVSALASVLKPQDVRIS